MGFSWSVKNRETDRMLAAMNRSYQNLLNTLDSFNSDSVQPINKVDLEDFPLFEWVVLNDKIKIRKRKMLFGDHMNFDTYLENGGEFGKHFHEDLIESAEVISGGMIDLVDNKRYQCGDVMHYEKGEVHKPVATKNTMLKVIFKP